MLYYKRVQRMMTRIVAMILAFGYALSAVAQADSPAVLYDPVFWKDDLKLKHEQLHEIEAVNHEFYERIIETYHETTDDRKALDEVIVQCSIERSNQIWQIFSPKQRKKWTKIWSERYAGGDG